MQITVDGNANYALTGPVADIVGAVAAAGEALSAQGRSIVRVQIDGRDVKPEQLREAIGNKPVADVKILAISTKETKALIEECLKELGEAAPDLAQLCRELAAVFQGQNPNEGFEPFHKLAEIWAHVKEQEMRCVTALHLQMDDMQLDGRSLGTLTSELNRYLKEAEQALSKGDTVLLGDLLEYELAPRAEQEPKIVALLQRHAGQVSSAR
jgi:hypothetical protein